MIDRLPTYVFADKVWVKLKLNRIMETFIHDSTWNQNNIRNWPFSFLISITPADHPSWHIDVVVRSIWKILHRKVLHKIPLVKGTESARILAWIPVPRKCCHYVTIYKQQICYRSILSDIGSSITTTIERRLTNRNKFIKSATLQEDYRRVKPLFKHFPILYSANTPINEIQLK